MGRLFRNRARPAAFLIVLALSSPVSAGLISDVGVIPNPFSPNDPGDGVYDECTLSYTLSEQAWVNVTVNDSLEAVRSFGSESQSEGGHSVVWDGRGDDGFLRDDGFYWFVIEVNGAPEEEVRVALDTAPPEPSDLAPVPSLFTPDGDGMADSVFVSVTFDVLDPTDGFALTVLDNSQVSIRTLASGTGVDSIGVYWDGTDAGGLAAPDTLYTIHLETWDVAGNRLEESALIDLDVEAPSLGLAVPDSLEGVIRVYEETEIAVRGWAYDRSGVDSLEISFDGGDSWFLPDSTGVADDRPVFLWRHAFACTACAVDSLDETLALSVRAHDGTVTADGLGHVNGPTGPEVKQTLEFDVVFDVAGPRDGAAEVADADTVYSAGETITISATWDDSGYDIDADFGDVDASFSPTAVGVVADGSTYTITYEIEEPLLPTTYTAGIRITATDHYVPSGSDSIVSRTSDPVTVMVTVVPGNQVITRLTVDRNSFSPVEGDDVEIDIGSGFSGTLLVEIYNMAGILVRSIEESGSSVAWDGRNSDGEIVASGVYFLRIEAGGDDEIRKVAVVK